MAKPTNHREKIRQYLEILKLKMTEEQLDAFVQQHSQGTLSVSQILAKFLEGPANVSQESAIQSRINASTAFDGFRETALWLTCYHALLPTLSWFGQSATYLIPTLGLVVFPLIFFALFFFTLFLMKKILGLQENTFFLMAICTYALVPIALAYNIAHYFSLLLVEGQSIVPLLSDPLHLGWNLFDTVHFIPNIGIIGASAAWNMQVGVVVVGHIIAVILAQIAVQKFICA